MYLIFFFFFAYLFEEAGKERDRESSCPQGGAQMPAIAQEGPDQNQELETQFKTSTWMAVTQLFESSIADFQQLIRRMLQSEAKTGNSNPGILKWDKGISTSSIKASSCIWYSKIDLIKCILIQ